MLTGEGEEVQRDNCCLKLQQSSEDRKHHMKFDKQSNKFVFDRKVRNLSNKSHLALMVGTNNIRAEGKDERVESVDHEEVRALVEATKDQKCKSKKGPEVQK